MLPSFVTTAGVRSRACHRVDGFSFAREYSVHVETSVVSVVLVALAVHSTSLAVAVFIVGVIMTVVM